MYIFKLKLVASSLLILSLLALLALPVMADELTIVGTGDGTEVLKNIGNAFSHANRGITVNVPRSIGSGGGVKAVGGGQYLLGRVARPPKKKEEHFGLTYIPAFKVPVVFFVNENVRINGLSSRDVIDIYSGKITSWDEVGGSGTIRVITREKDDSSLKILSKTFPGFGNIKITSQAKSAIETPEMIVSVLYRTGAIGFGPLDVAKAKGLKVLKIDGKSPTDNGYPSLGTIGFVYKSDNFKGAVKKFVEFATSAAAHTAIENAGGIPII